ncbi:hypothetical protein JQ596_01515 [Bradyrhizobium manausense]|uniref:hypothetical protein n=1 Tax=Bradyrhizobium TaxID=374 RepID=UPI001BAD008C|nr:MULTISPECIES: hypothetical protein [Bradyrhizobium]MBR0824196.1 hypothetical protein [Bradyrhizobium manausense]UVO26598.1 hypothetical protein KUF59_29120 [Bradyrhizobium arachidis]
MIIDGRGTRLRAIGKIAAAVALVVAGWLALVIVLTFGTSPGRSMAVIGPQAQALAAIARADGRVLSSNAYVTIARSNVADFVSRLYASGALLVLDAEQAGGCNGLAPKREQI